jgi:hypothetical protein
MSEVQDVRRYRGTGAMIHGARPARIGRAGRSSPRRSPVSESGADVGGGVQAVVSSPQQREALHSLAAAYKALLQETHPDYDWVVEIQE